MPSLWIECQHLPGAPAQDRGPCHVFMSLTRSPSTMRSRSFLSLLPLVLCALTVGACAPQPADPVEPMEIVPATDFEPVLSRAPQVSLIQATRPADSVLFDAMQADLRSLTFRDGLFRAVSRSGPSASHADVRDAVWKALFLTTQGSTQARPTARTSASPVRQLFASR